jgi:hypothetical protein
MCNPCETYNSNGELIEEGGGGGEPPEVETTLHYTVSFNPNVDHLALVDPLYSDDYIALGFDAPGNDLEGIVKQGSALYESYLTRNHSSATNTLMSIPNFKYDLYPSGITSIDNLNGGLACYNNPTAPYYRINVQRTGSSSQCILNIEIHNQVVDKT